MKKLLTIIFLLPLFVLAQNPINTPLGYEPGGNPRLLSTPDTVYYTVTGKRTGGMFSNKVALSYTKVVKPYKAPVVTPPPPADLAPTVNLGMDQSYTLAQGEISRIVSLSATVSDESPSTVTYLWTGTGVSATAKTQNISLAAGTYTYTLKVTDAGGKSATDEIKITINPAIVTPPPTDPPPTTDWPTWAPFSENDFSTSITKGFTSYIQQPDKINTMFLTKEFGFPALKISISRDQAVAGNNYRSEITHAKADKPLPTDTYDMTKEDDERWYEFDVYMPNYLPDNEESFFQIHQSSSSGSPPSALYTQNNRIRYNYITVFNGQEKYWTTDWPLPTGWFNVRMYYKFSSGSSAMTKLWLDGKLVMTNPAPNLFAGQTNYMKLGLYKWAWKLPLTDKNQPKAKSRLLYYRNWKAWKK